MDIFFVKARECSLREPESPAIAIFRPPLPRILAIGIHR